MNILLDTDVLSLLAPERPAAPPAMRHWIEEKGSSLFISVVTVAEIERGLRKLARMGRSRKAEIIRGWFSLVTDTYAERILPFDIEAARIAGRLDDLAAAKGFNMLFADVAIAATAARHDMAVATRNIRRFEPLGVRLAEMPI
ncbi:MAG TPA: PIN domain-containing protein [Rhodoblastus sp.]|nr:PIN domain-containing protein [Rhodoblastus sp.]